MRYSKEQRENIIDPLLGFNDTQTWSTSSGTGSAGLDTNLAYQGDSCLSMLNTAPTTDFVITNATQSTLIAFDGDYIASIRLRKDIVDEFLDLEMKTFVGITEFNTQTFTLGSEDTDEDLLLNDRWVSFSADIPFNLNKGNVVTFTFNLKGKAGTLLANTTIKIDGFKLEPIDSQNMFPSAYEKSNALDLYSAYTGWADYTDTAYTTGAPFTATDNGTAVALPNDKGSFNESQKPIDVDTFYDGTVITGRNGDGINITIDFKCRPNGTGADPRLDVYLDIGGAIPPLYTRSFFLNKGNGVEHNYLSSFNGYTLNTWEANGATIYVEAFGEEIEIYDIRYVITRTHKAR